MGSNEMMKTGKVLLQGIKGTTSIFTCFHFLLLYRFSFLLYYLVDGKHQRDEAVYSVDGDEEQQTGAICCWQ